MDKKLDVTTMPSLNLAFIGDSVYEILTREYGVLQSSGRSFKSNTSSAF